MSNQQYASVFDEEEMDGASSTARSVHRIRSNSTIMQLKKIMGMSGVLSGVKVGVAG